MTVPDPALVHEIRGPAPTQDKKLQKPMDAPSQGTQVCAARSHPDAS